MIFYVKKNPHNILYSKHYTQAFGDIVVRDGELVSVELTASDRHGRAQGVIFLGAVRYEVLKKVYDARVSCQRKLN